MSSYGDTLTPRKTSGLLENEETELEGDIGFHSCNDWMSIVEISTTHNVIYCPTCLFRIVVPKSVKNYLNLRGYMELVVKPSS